MPSYSPDGFVWPRLETARPESVGGTYGGAAAEWVETNHGMTLRPWQRYALDRALEHDANGDLVWPTVIITVARQSGKSWLSRALCLWRLHSRELFDEEQTILHVANRRQTAMEVMRPAGLWATEKYGQRAVKWGNMESGITVPDGGRWLIHAANDSAGVGYSISLAFVDEAWKVRRDVIDDAIAPTMASRKNPQLILVSTAGDSSSDLMSKYRDRALDQLNDPQPGSTLLLEWSAPPDANPDESTTWEWASPQWSEARRVFLAQQHANIEESAFRREWLNQWVTRADHWLRDSVWQETTDESPLPDGTWNIAVEADFDGMGHAVAIAAADKSGTIYTRVTTHRTIAQVDERLAEIQAQHQPTRVYITPGYIDRIKTKYDGTVGSKEAPAATQTILDLFDRRAIRHTGDLVLQEHLAATTISRRQGGWVLTAPMGHGGVYAARALMFAVWTAAKTPRPVAQVHTRRRTR